MESFYIVVCILWLIIGVDYIVQQYVFRENPEWWKLWLVYGCFMICYVIPNCVNSIVALF